MYLLMCASRFTVKLPDILIRALCALLSVCMWCIKQVSLNRLAVLSEPQQGPPRVRTLCFLILQECGISKALRIDRYAFVSYFVL